MKNILSTLFFTFIVSISFSQKTTTEYWDNGQKKQEGILLGSAEISKADVPEQRADRKNSLKDGKWNYWYENGVQRSEEFYKMGAETGIWRSWYENGKLSSETNYETGKTVKYYKDGKKHSEGGIIKGNLHEGKWIGWFENGNTNYTGTYKNGQKDGQWLWYNDKGDVTTREVYKDGAKVE